MPMLAATFSDALALLATFDHRVAEIVGLSLRVSGGAVVLGTLIGLPLGACIAVGRFPGKAAVSVLINGLMGLPSVVVGVVVYLLLSRSGPLGGLGLLYTPPAMIVAQTLLVVPLMAAIARQVVEDAWQRYAEELAVMRFSWWQSVTTLLYDCRHSLLVAVLAGLGRAMSEVGAVMIVGGNIDRATRVMTTAIALETSKGDLPLAIALGIVLILIILALNALAFGLRRWATRRFG
ncbi:MAG: ABC transporter permease [Thauera sp.]|nr:ABC transporter permease [Thauera sp.]